MRLIFILLFALLSTGVSYADDWTCTEVASIKNGDAVLVCGVATEDDEGSAREQALLRAQREFSLICEGSADCHGRQTNIEPLRNTCSELEDGRFKCYRGLRYTLLGEGFNRQEEISESPAAIDDFPRRKSMTREKRRWTVGISSFNLNIGTEDTVQRRKMAGGSMFVRYSVWDLMTLMFGYSRLTGSAVKTNHVYSSEYLVLFGRRLMKPGLQTYLGIGGFVSTWESATKTEDISGAVVNLGVGWNAPRWNVTFEYGSYVSQKLNDLFEQDGTTNFRFGAAYRF